MERWQAVVPWCKYLRGRLEIEERERDDSLLKEPWWLLVMLPKTRRSASAGHLQRIREALELLSLVASVDDAAWKQLLRDKCGVFFDTHERVKQREPLAPRFIFVLDDHTKETLMWPSTLCSKLFFQLGVTSPNQDFLDVQQHVRDIIATSFYRSAESRGATAPIPFCLYFSPRLMDTTAFATYLHTVVRIVQALHSDAMSAAASTDSPSVVAPFVLDAIQLNLTEFELTEPVTRVLTELVQLGVKVSCLQLPLKATDFIDDDECPRHALATCLNAVVGSCSAYLDAAEAASDLGGEASEGAIDDLRGSKSSRARSKTEAIVVNDLSVDDRRFAALCAALTASTSVKELTLESTFLHDSPRARQLKWKWLAYALLSHESRSSVRKLVVSEASLLPEDVDAIASVLRAPFPAKELADPLWSTSDGCYELCDADPSDSDTDDGVHTVVLDEGAVIFLEPVCSEAEWLSTSLVLPARASFVVMRHSASSEWLEIVAPGFGTCWVHRHFVETLQTRLDDPGDWVLVHQCSKITSFTLALDRVEDSQGQTIAALFRLIGSELTSLTIQASRLHGDCLESILRSCPKLTTLTLKGAQVDSMDVFTRAYEKHACQIASLTLKDFRIDVASFTRFAYALATPTHPSAQHLRELCLGSFDRHHPLDEDSVLAFLVMLEKNAVLTYLELHIDTFLFDIYAPSIMQHHNRLLPPSRAVPIPVACQEAFLSLFSDGENARASVRDDDVRDDIHTCVSMVEQRDRPSRWSRRRQPLPRLDTNAVALIFAFAAEQATRIVCLVEY